MPRKAPRRAIVQRPVIPPSGPNRADALKHFAARIVATLGASAALYLAAQIDEAADDAE